MSDSFEFSDMEQRLLDSGFELILPPGSEMLQAVGLVAVQWGYLEYEIDQQIKWLHSFPSNEADLLNFRAPFKQRGRQWRKMARRVFNAEFIGQVEDISVQANAIKPRRDAIVHGVFAGGSDSMSLSTYRSAEFVNYEDTNAETIMEVARRISVVGADMLRHSTKVLSAYAERPQPPMPHG
ncbi:hypothetical protein [Thalassobaculum sp.]|uniref:hypothetical protein n=1 Tax=Thalassobaculum sp. TaxID=2022740 RepID=UPI003B5C2E98